MYLINSSSFSNILAQDKSLGWQILVSLEFNTAIRSCSSLHYIHRIIRFWFLTWISWFETVNLSLVDTPHLGTWLCPSCDDIFHLCRLELLIFFLLLLQWVNVKYCNIKDKIVCNIFSKWSKQRKWNLTNKHQVWYHGTYPHPIFYILHKMFLCHYHHHSLLHPTQLQHLNSFLKFWFLFVCIYLHWYYAYPPFISIHISMP